MAYKGTPWAVKEAVAADLTAGKKLTSNEINGRIHEAVIAERAAKWNMAHEPPTPEVIATQRQRNAADQQRVEPKMVQFLDILRAHFADGQDLAALAELLLNDWVQRNASKNIESLILEKKFEVPMLIVGDPDPYGDFDDPGALDDPADGDDSDLPAIELLNRIGDLVLHDQIGRHINLHTFIDEYLTRNRLHSSVATATFKYPRPAMPPIRRWYGHKPACGPYLRTISCGRSQSHVIAVSPRCDPDLHRGSTGCG
jgi:hypothetical protein